MLKVHSQPREGYLKDRDESKSENHSVVSDSSRPHELYSLWNSPGQKLEWVAFPFSRGSIHPRSPALQEDSLLAEPQGSPLL